MKGEADTRSDTTPLLVRFCSFVDATNLWVGYVMAVAVIGMTVLIALETITRAAGHPTVWSSEVSVYLLVCVAFLGAGYTEQVGGHTNVDTLPNLLSPMPRRLLSLFNWAVALFAAVFLAYMGMKVALEAIVQDRRSVTVLRIPLGLLYLSLPLGMVMLALQYLRNMLRAINPRLFGTESLLPPQEGL